MKQNFLLCKPWRCDMKCIIYPVSFGFIQCIKSVWILVCLCEQAVPHAYNIMCFCGCTCTSLCTYTRVYVPCLMLPVEITQGFFTLRQRLTTTTPVPVYMSWTQLPDLSLLTLPSTPFPFLPASPLPNVIYRSVLCLSCVVTTGYPIYHLWNWSSSFKGIFLLLALNCCT